MEVHKEDIEKIINVLGRLAANSSEAQNFFHDLIRRANIPEFWEIELLQKKELSASDLIYWARSKGKNLKDDRYHTLGSILNALLNDTGDQEEIAFFMVRYELCDISLLPKNLQIKIKDQDIIQQKLKYSIISKTAKDELEDILKKINNFSVVKNACKRSLPRLAHDYALSISRIDQVFTLLLEEFQYGKDDVPRILEFASRLTQDYKVKKQTHLDLKAWFSDHRLEKPVLNSSDTGKPLLPRLFVKVSPHNLVSGHFSVRAWLFVDQCWLMPDASALEEVYNTSKDFFDLNLMRLCNDKYISSEPLENINDSPEKKAFNLIKRIKNELENKTWYKDSGDLEPFERGSIKEISFKEEELREVLALFLNESLLILDEEKEEYNNLDTNDLIIEIFLPFDLLRDCDIDKWNVPLFAFDNEDCNLGRSYTLLVRSQERSNWLQKEKREYRKYARKRESWQRRWKAAAKLETLPGTAIQNLDDFDGKSLSALLENKIGATIIRASKKDALLEAVLNSEAVPIVLWTRGGDLAVNHSDELSHLLHEELLTNIPQCVLKKRKDAIEQDDNHLGSHLVLLWDDPNRFPPSDDNLKFPA